MKILIVVDMQNDFITGPLGTEAARAIVPKVAAKIRKYQKDGNPVLATMDTHTETYLDSHEGKKLPVKHCICGTDGWQLCPEIDELIPAKNRKKKNSFGLRRIDSEILRELYYKGYFPESDMFIEIVGVCTDICVISNALIVRSVFPNATVVVDASCCAGTTPEMHEKALDVMRSCQIDINDRRNC